MPKHTSAPQLSGTPTRRQFVAATVGVATTATWAKPWWAGSTNPGERLTLGVIGVGKRGRRLLAGPFLSNDGFQVLAVCDVDSSRRTDAKELVDKHYGNTDCTAHVDYHELLARKDLDAVFIATPDHWHAIQIIDACKARKHIYCEKPLTFTLRESQLVIEAARKYDVVFQTGSQQRTEFGQRFVTACEHVRNGHIGKVLNINVGVREAPIWCNLGQEPMEQGLDWDRWLGPAPTRSYHSDLSPRGVHNHYPSWRAYREYSGGYLADMGAHHFDIAQWGLKADTSGPVKVVPPSDPTATRGASLVYADGARLTHGGPSGTTFIGESGMLHVDRGRIMSAPADILKKELGENEEVLPRSKGHAVEWLDSIKAGRKPICDVEVGARSVAICHLMNIAYWHRRELQWDPVTWRFVGDEEANGWLDYERREGYELPAF